MQNLIGTRYVGELLSYFTNIKCNIHCQHERTFSEKRFLPLVFTQAASVHGVHCILTLGSSSRNLANTSSGKPLGCKAFPGLQLA